MIYDLKPRLIPDHRGAITCGTRNGQGYPQKLDHWNILAFPELTAVYGTEPKELLVYVPGTLEEVFDCYKGAWGGKTAKRLCDGRECTHRIAEKVGGVQYGEGELSNCVCNALPADSKERCVVRGRLYVMVAHPETRQIISPCIYVMRTGSYSNVVSIYSELWRITSLAQALPGHPELHQMLFSISIHMASSSGSAKKTFPVWRMQAIPSESYFRQVSAGQAAAAMPIGAGFVTPRQLSERTEMVEEHDVEIVGDEEEVYEAESEPTPQPTPQPTPPSAASAPLPGRERVATAPGPTRHQSKPPAASVQMPPPSTSSASANDPLGVAPEPPTSDRAMATKAMMATFHQLGKELYGTEKWETQQDTIATWISKGSAPLAGLMTAEETQAACWILQLKTYSKLYGVRDEEWKAIVRSIGLIDITKITERQYHQIQWLQECQVSRTKHGWTELEWDYLVGTIGVVDMAALDSATAEQLKEQLATRHDDIAEAIQLEAIERGA